MYVIIVQAHSDVSGKVVGVADGETITVLASGNRQVKECLYGIDCPEKKQAFGQRATQFMASRVAGQNVNVEILDIDRYGRSVGAVRTSDGGNLNRELLANGFAWHYTRYCKASFCSDWKQEELRPVRGRKGLWADKTRWSRGTGANRTGGNRLTKAEFAEKMLQSGKFKTKAEALRVIDAVLGKIRACMVSEGSISPPNLGIFKDVQRNERKARDMRTGAEIIIPARKVPKFTAAKN